MQSKMKTETSFVLNNKTFLVEFTLADYESGPLTEYDIDFIWCDGILINQYHVTYDYELDQEVRHQISAIRTLVMNELIRSQPEFVYQNGV